ncbi:hypothetical protein SAMN05421638_1578 [Kaistella treverensis]|uniref:Cytochrome C and Quinol oxidase polypeptide I n=1 Tax=Kaistella treverensis TaxID=631455 RepID=A0A1I3M7N9_9FLAO|nr:hypothetical protein [Kaistella treverensis]SFI92978.1 hypothetical protein SAMN05421638_1578 [Kaistella treverensis]
MAHINIGKAPGNGAVLPFYATGAVMFLVLCLLMLFTPETFTKHYFTPHLLTIVHVAALGWGTMVIFGAAHQLLPVICEQDLYSEKLAAFVWYTLTLGMVLLTTHFWKLTVGWVMIFGGSLIVFSVILYLFNVWKTTKICTKYSIQKLYVLSSAIWLLFTVVMGLLLAINLKFSFFNVSHLEILKLHAHVGFAGWFLQLITGVSSKLVPMFLLGKSKKENLLKYAFIFQNAGLILFLADGYFIGVTSRVLIYALITFVGIIFWLLFLYDNYKNRLRKRVELLMKHSFLSFLALIIAVLLIPAVYFAEGYRWAMLYGTLIFMGWITSIILGKTFKTLPFIIWNDHYKNLSGKVKVPLPKDLYSEKLTVWQFRIFIAAFLVFATGIILESVPVIRSGAVLWCVVAVLYNVNVFKLILHTKKQTQ